MEVSYDKAFRQVALIGGDASTLFMALRDLHGAMTEGYEDEAGPGVIFEAGGLTYILQDSETEGGILTVMESTPQ